jgi:hypothetical protein
MYQIKQIFLFYVQIKQIVVCYVPNKKQIFLCYVPNKTDFLMLCFK